MLANKNNTNVNTEVVILAQGMMTPSMERAVNGTFLTSTWRHCGLDRDVIFPQRKPGTDVYQCPDVFGRGIRGAALYLRVDREIPPQECYTVVYSDSGDYIRAERYDERDRSHRQYLQLEDRKGLAAVWVIQAYYDGSFRVTHVRLFGYGTAVLNYEVKQEVRIYKSLGAIRYRAKDLTDSDWMVRAAAQARDKTDFSHPTRRAFTEPLTQPRQIKRSKEPTEWIEETKRHFRCLSCGATERLTKGDYRAYRDGKVFTLTCCGCGRSGQI